MVSIINSRNIKLFFSILLIIEAAFCCQLINAEETQLETIEVHSQNQSSNAPQIILLSNYDYAFGDLNSVLGRIPGFQIQSAGGHGAYSTFTLRGSSAKSVPVYFDGIKVNDPLSGGLNLSTFPLWSLQSIDVYKSLIPAELANNSGTSVINLKSQTIESKQDLKLSTGSFGRQSVSGNVATNKYLFSAEYLSADNEFSYQHNNQTPLYSGDDYATNRLNNQVQRKFMLLKAKEQIANYKFNLMAIHRQYDTGISNNLNQATNAELKQESTLLSANITKNNWDLYINSDFANQQYDDSKGEIGLSIDTQVVKHQKNELKIINKSNLGAILSTVSIQGQREETNKLDTINDTSSSGTIDSASYSIAHSLDFNKAIKFNHSFLTQNTDSSHYQAYNTGLEYSVKYTRELSSDISLSKKTRLPTIAELHLNQGNIIANPDLKPEDFYELNFRTKFNFSSAGGQFEIYVRDSNDTIIYSYDAGGIGRASNEGSSQMAGVESQVYWHIGRAHFNWNMELIDTKNTSNNKASNSNQLPAFFHASQYASLDFWFDELSLGITNQRRYDMYYDSANLVKAPNQNLWGITANYHHYPWQLGIHVNNIFDKYYTGLKTEPLPGRSFILTFTISN